jgi:hypothetical protein
MSFRKEGDTIVLVKTQRVGNIKGRITRLKREAQHAREQSVIWLETASKLEKQLAELQELIGCVQPDKEENKQ